MQTVITPDQSRQARRELGLSQADVAEATGFKRPYISDYESGTALRFTPSQLRKLRTFYEAKIAEANEAGESIDLTFGDIEGGEATSKPVASIDVVMVPSKRFQFQIDDAVSDDTQRKALELIRANDTKLADLLTRAADKESGLLGSGNFTLDTLEAIRDSLSLLACNYLVIRTVTGWPEVGLAASNDSLVGNDVLSVILGSVQEEFAAAGLSGQATESPLIADEMQEEAA